MGYGNRKGEVGDHDEREKGEKWRTKYTITLPMG